MTGADENAMITIVFCTYTTEQRKIEVAFFKSRSPDVTGTGESEGKGKTPKEPRRLQGGSWAYDQKSYDCHPVRMVRYQRKHCFYLPAHEFYVPALFMKISN